MLGVLAGLLYNSWPLGFVLDRRALAGTYLSVLEMPGRPYGHVFVACDLAAGVLAATAGLLLLRERLVAAGLVIFGLGTVLEAVIPLASSCATSVASCGVALGEVLAPHNLASIVSDVGIMVALWALRDHSRWMRAVIALWAATGLFLRVSVLVSTWVTLSQVCFLVGCGVAVGGASLASRPGT